MSDSGVNTGLQDGAPDFRPRFHFSAPRGWINDPNGFSFHDGRFHLFYQYNPYDSKWASMHWGHATSVDLLAWEHLEPALYPGESYDLNGCFSGSALSYRGEHILLYTGHVDDGKQPAIQVQCLAIGDGKRYAKHPANPVLGQTALPPDSNMSDFRDPKLWTDGTTWYCLAVDRHRDGHGRILFFSGTDPAKLAYRGIAFERPETLPAIWECPDIAKIDGVEVLIWSIAGQAAEPYRFQSVSSVLWAKGRLDLSGGAFSTDGFAELDQGPDFYAPQTTTTRDGRVIMIAWLQSWKRSMPTHDLKLGWAGQMTIPRELSWSGGIISQRPIRELAAFRRREIRKTATIEDSVSWAELRGRCMDLELRFESKAKSVGLRIFAGDSSATTITWEPGSSVLIFDRSASGIPISSDAASHPQCDVFRAKLRPDADRLSLRIVLDISTIEIFAQDGTTAMSATVYPDPAAEGVEFFSEGGPARLDVVCWSLEKG